MKNAINDERRLTPLARARFASPFRSPASARPRPARPRLPCSTFLFSIQADSLLDTGHTSDHPLPRPPHRPRHGNNGLCSQRFQWISRLARPRRVVCGRAHGGGKRLLDASNLGRYNFLPTRIGAEDEQEGRRRPDGLGFAWSPDEGRGRRVCKSRVELGLEKSCLGTSRYTTYHLGARTAPFVPSSTCFSLLTDIVLAQRPYI